MSDEYTFKELEVQKLNLQQNDVLMVTVKHEDVDQYSMEQLSKKLETIFPNNKVMVFAMGNEGYVKFTVASQTQMSYCSDCNCGKKEEALLGKASADALRSEVEKQIKETEND